MGKHVKAMGFDGIEFPLRPGFRVEPEDAEKGLPALSGRLSEYGIKVTSIAAAPDEKSFTGCAKTRYPYHTGNVENQHG